jgi:hypothetical protein
LTHRNAASAETIFKEPALPRDTMLRAPDTASDSQNGESLSDILLECSRAAALKPTTIDDLSRMLGDRSIEALLLVLASPMVVPVPAPGISIAFGIPMMMLAVQLAIGRRNIWLPNSIARRPIDRAGIAAAFERSLPALRRLEHIVRPRLVCLSGAWARIPIGAICFVLAAVITLPFPLGHFVPGLAICLLALGLLERDGVIVGLGIVSSLVGVALVSVASIGASRIVSQWWG